MESNKERQRSDCEEQRQDRRCAFTKRLRKLGKTRCDDAHAWFIAQHQCGFGDQALADQHEVGHAARHDDTLTMTMLPYWQPQYDTTAWLMRVRTQWKAHHNHCVRKPRPLHADARRAYKDSHPGRARLGPGRRMVEWGLRSVRGGLHEQGQPQFRYGLRRSGRGRLTGICGCRIDCLFRRADQTPQSAMEKGQGCASISM